MFNAAIDSKLCGFDLVRLRIGEVHFGDTIEPGNETSLRAAPISH